MFLNELSQCLLSNMSSITLRLEKRKQHNNWLQYSNKVQYYPVSTFGQYPEQLKDKTAHAEFNVV